jgi:hypothetical protein
LAEIDAIIANCTRHDGTSGEKGLAGYTSFALCGLASFLSFYAEADPSLLAGWLRAHPKLARAWTFHLDTWCLDAYYPTCGDAGGFARPFTEYPALRLPGRPRLGAQNIPPSQVAPSMYLFLWQLWQASGDDRYAQLLWRLNADSAEQLPRAFVALDEPALQAELAAAAAAAAGRPQAGVDLQDWHLAIQHAGADDRRRTLWLDYDSGGLHGHRDALNLGLFAYGLDLLPDFGYPPVGFAGGWTAPKAKWYISTAAHHTVVVDRCDQNINGWHCDTAGDYVATYDQTIRTETSAWIDAPPCRGMRCAVDAYNACTVYDRCAIMVDIDDDDFYIVDVFRVVGGSEHVKFVTSQFATLTTDIELAAIDPLDFGEAAQLRNWRWADRPGTPWHAAFAIDDRFGVGTGGGPVALHYTDLTAAAAAATCEAWVVWGRHDRNPTEEAWVPRLAVCRHAPLGGPPLASCFVAVLEPTAGERRVARITRAPTAAMDVALIVELADGRVDRLLLRDGDGAGMPAGWPAMAPGGFAFARGR